MTAADPNPEYWQEYGQFQKVKHDLIKGYLSGWFPKLGTWAGRVLYVDTHAGRGRHSSGETGSPLVALDTLLHHSYCDKLLEKSEVGFFFIEQDPTNLKALNDELDEIGNLPDRVHVEISEGNAYDVLSSVVQSLRESRTPMAPAFIFVDPYGFKVPGDLLQQLMGAGRVELFINVRWRELNMAITQQRDSRHGLAATLDVVFAGDDWRRIEGDTPHERMHQAVELLARKIGARWATYIRMTSGGAATRYLLLHLTNHDEGRDLMKECMWKVAPDGGFEVLQRDDPRQPFLITPSPNLEPLREWLLERLERRPHTREELARELRPTPWPPSHLRKLAGQLRRERRVDFDAASGTYSLPSNRRLFSF